MLTYTGSCSNVYGLRAGSVPESTPGQARAEEIPTAQAKSSAITRYDMERVHPDDVYNGRHALDSGAYRNAIGGRAQSSWGEGEDDAGGPETSPPYGAQDRQGWAYDQLLRYL